MIYYIYWLTYIELVMHIKDNWILVYILNMEIYMQICI